MRAAAALLLVALAAPAGAQTWEAVRETDRITGEVRAAHAIRRAVDGPELLVVQCIRLADVVVWRVHVQLGRGQGTIGPPRTAVPVRWRVDPEGATGEQAWTVNFEGVHATLSDAEPAVREEPGPAAALVRLLAGGLTAVLEVPRAGGRPVQRSWDLRGLTAGLRQVTPVGCALNAG